MLVSFALGDANFSRHPTQNPNASQWNIGCVGSQTQISRIGHVHFLFFGVDFIQWNMGFKSPGHGLSIDTLYCIKAYGQLRLDYGY